MAKTIDLQIEKSAVLIDGLKKNIGELTDKGFSMEELDGMEQQLNALRAANQVCDDLRRELSQRVKEMNALLAQVKAQYAAKKGAIKGYYLQEEWQRFGVMDKR